MAASDTQSSAPLLKLRPSEPAKTRILINVYDLIPVRLAQPFKAATADVRTIA